MSWADWKKLHPKTKVLTGPKGHPRMGHYGLRGRPDQYGWSLGQGRKTKLYPYRELARKAVRD